MQIIPHGVSLSLGSAEGFDPKRAARLAELARRLDSPLVSEHIAYVRAGGVEAGHLLPLPRTNLAADVVVANVLAIKELLPVPIALENIATLFQWPDRELDEGSFLRTILDRTGAALLLDVANIWANARNFGHDPGSVLATFPLDRLAYVHVAGGEVREGRYHDTHTAAVPAAVFDLLGDLCQMTTPAGIMLERDDHFPPASELNCELDTIAQAMALHHEPNFIQRAPSHC